MLNFTIQKNKQTFKHHSNFKFDVTKVHFQITYILKILLINFFQNIVVFKPFVVKYCCRIFFIFTTNPFIKDYKTNELRNPISPPNTNLTKNKKLYARFFLILELQKIKLLDISLYSSTRFTPSLPLF